MCTRLHCRKLQAPLHHVTPLRHDLTLRPYAVTLRSALSLRHDPTSHDLALRLYAQEAPAPYVTVRRLGVSCFRDRLQAPASYVTALLYEFNVTTFRYDLLRYDFTLRRPWLPM